MKEKIAAYASSASVASASFISSLNRRLSADTSFGAKLRREAGGRPSETRMPLKWHTFLESVPQELRSGRKADIAFLIATFYSLDSRRYKGLPSVNATPPAADEAADAPRSVVGTGDLGSTLGSMISGKDIERDPMTRRLAKLLNSTLDPDGGGTLPRRLRNTVDIALASNAKINWPRLLDDLVSWNDPKRRVQHGWARSFLARAQPDDAQGAASDVMEMDNDSNS